MKSCDVFFFTYFFSDHVAEAAVGRDAGEDIWKAACMWMETEVQPDSGLWVFVVT